MLVGKWIDVEHRFAEIEQAKKIPQYLLRDCS
jgi:hypothetical protein